MTTERISRGLTFKGIISAIGSVIFVVGILITVSQMTKNISFVIVAIGSLMIIVGFILFISMRGVFIDSDKKRIKPYFNIIIAKFGSWKSLDQYDKIVLNYKNESQTLNSRGNSTNYVTKSFDIVLKSNSKKELILKEFVNYEKARSFLIEYSRRLDKESIDTYEKITERIQERKQQVRR